MTLSKKQRKNLLDQQQDCCNLCGHHFGQGLHSSYDEQTNTMLCRLCHLLLNCLRKSVVKGVDLGKVVEYDMTNRIPG